MRAKLSRYRQKLRHFQGGRRLSALIAAFRSAAGSRVVCAPIQSPRLREAHGFIFGRSFVSPVVKAPNSACSRTVTKMIYGADASLTGTRVTDGDACRSHSADH
jgi:hypothetical protein